MITVPIEYRCTNADLASLFAELPDSMWTVRMERLISGDSKPQDNVPMRFEITLVAHAVENKSEAKS